MARKKPKLTMLSFGGGQDSTAMLYMLAHDRKFRKEYAPNDVVVVFSDTGDEHQHTYLHLMQIEAFCDKQGIEYHHLLPHMGYHTQSWQTYRGQLERNCTCGSKAGKKTCTVNLKINPIYKFMNDWIAERYGYGRYGYPYKKHHALVCFAEDYGPFRVLIGFAAGEEGRVDDSPNPNRWFNLSIEKSYPLIDLGMDRAACQARIEALGYDVPYPSNCVLCPWMSQIELLWLFRTQPDDFYYWVELEKAKLKKFAHKGEKNLGVFGKKLLPEVLAQAETTYGNMSIEELNAYKFSHGHCVKSKY